jgi:hypothetical protein
MVTQCVREARPLLRAHVDDTVLRRIARDDAAVETLRSAGVH